jgi:hypothetical protein
MAELLVVALAICAVVVVMRKRYTSNLPLMFYLVALVFTNLADRVVSPYLMYSGLSLALLLRFEFMGAGFAKFVAFLNGGALCAVAWAMMSDVFGS